MYMHIDAYAFLVWTISLSMWEILGIVHTALHRRNAVRAARTASMYGDFFTASVTSRASSASPATCVSTASAPHPRP